MRCLMFAAVAALAVFSALNWRAQLQTQQKLEALTAALAERPAAPAPAEAVAPPPAPVPKPGEVPRELSHVTIPPYIIEAPDVLTIEAALADPKTGAVDRLPAQPISGSFIVRPDGTVGLGVWGSVYVAGSTTDQTSATIRKHLATFQPTGLPAGELKVTVEVVAYNSKRYYVIADVDGDGENVFPFPLTGNETVLDAVANVSGLPAVAGTRCVRVVRPRPNGGSNQVLPVEWQAITRHGITTTNYQLLPGDRVFVTRAAP